MPPRRRKRTRLEGKYVARRLILVLIIIAAISGGCIYLGYWMAERVQGESEKPSESETQSKESSSKPPEQPPVVSEESENPEELDEPEEQEALQAAAPVRVPELDAWNLILVNKQRELPADYQAEMETVVGEFKVDGRILEPLLRMLAAAKEDGISLIINSTYRTVEKQTVNFENYKNDLISRGKTEEQAYAETAEVINPPGFSEHHTGLAIDFMTRGFEYLDTGFEDTPAFGWLSENAESFGFVLRYPADKTDITEVIYEPWHYRYVGVEHAAAMNKAGICLEEYIQMLERSIGSALSESEAEEEE